MCNYTVLVDDNFHYMDEGEQYQLGKFDSCETAVAACKRIVDDFLLSSLETPRSQDALWGLFTAFGDSPLIVTADSSCKFSAWDYARQRCATLAQSRSEDEAGSHPTDL